MGKEKINPGKNRPMLIKVGRIQPESEPSRPDKAKCKSRMPIPKLTKAAAQIAISPNTTPQRRTAGFVKSSYALIAKNEASSPANIAKTPIAAASIRFVISGTIETYEGECCLAPICKADSLPVTTSALVLADYDNGAAVSSPTREYIFGNNRLATVTGSVSGSGGTITYEHRDSLSPRLFTDSNGNDVAEQGTDPFGNPWYNNGSTSHWVFTSHERDPENGIDYAQARSYASNLGRFMSPDPLEGRVGDPQSWNRYAYVENDPINITDPSGQGFWSDLGFAIADVFVAIFFPPALPALSAEETGAITTEEAFKAWLESMIAGGWFADRAIESSPGVHHAILYCGGGPCSQGTENPSGGSDSAGGGVSDPDSQGPTGGGVAGTDPSPNQAVLREEQVVRCRRVVVFGTNVVHGVTAPCTGLLTFLPGRVML